MRVNAPLVSYFPVSILPRAPYAARAIPASLAPDTDPAYSVPPAGDGRVAGSIAVNLYKRQSRLQYGIQLLVYHEGRRGHQLQIPIAMELKGLPQFSRFDYYSYYREGRALYTESVCAQMVLYSNPYSKFGDLDWQMWQTVRLVADTGIDSGGRMRAQPVRHFENNTALSTQKINAAVDRYIAWPGQTLSYMIGQMNIFPVRQKAEHGLGPKLNIRDLHTLNLEHGALPLTILIHVIDRWVRNRQAGKPMRHSLGL